MACLLAFGLIAVLGSAGAAPAQPAAASPDVHLAIRQALEAARPEGTIRATTARLTRDERVRNSEALRLFVSGVAALLSFDRQTAERDLSRSFALSPSPHTALALTANAVEMGDAEATLVWAERGAAVPGAEGHPGLIVELQLARAQALVWQLRRDEYASEVAEALERARNLGDPRLLALALRAEAVRLGDTGRPEAVERFEEAVRLSEGDARAIAYHLLLLNTFYYPSRPYAEKVPLLDRVLRYARQLRDRQLEGRALGARGAALSVLNRYGEALRDLTAADALLRETRADRSRASVAGNLSLLLADLGDYERADQQARLAVTLYRRVRNAAGARLSLDDLGRIALLQGRPALAVSRHEQAVSLTRELGDPIYLRTALTRLGLAYMAQRRWGPAERALDEALRLAADGRDADSHESARVARADLLRAMGRNAEAERTYRQALVAAPGLGSAGTLLVRIHHGLGRLDAGAGRIDSALEHYRAALSGIETARAGAGSAELRLTYFADKTALYSDAIDALVEAHQRSGDQARLGEALTVAERAKARTLLDAVAPGAGSSETDVATPEDVAAALGPSEVLLEFVVGARRGHVFTVRRGGPITVHPLPARTALDAQVAALRRLVTERPTAADDVGEVRRLGSVAYASLLESALADVPDATRLVIVPDGPLFYAPFEAFTIPASGRYLGEAFEVVREASASVFRALRGRPGSAGCSSRFVGFGDPRVAGGVRTDAALMRALERDGFSFAPLPGSRREVEEAAAALGATDTRIYTGPAFTPGAVLSELQQPSRVIHFATHAILDERVPTRSGIVTSGTEADGGASILRVRDLTALKIPAELVVLSACQTGLGSLVAGEGVMGLTWAFGRAGVASQVVTLWNVSDAASAQGMASFYRALAAGHTPSSALRTTRRAMLDDANPSLHHPYFWAGYVLVGSP